MRFLAFKENVAYTTFFDNYEKGSEERPDYNGMLCYGAEYAQTLIPQLTYLELDRDDVRPLGELSTLWKERVGKWKASRTIPIHAPFKADSARKQVHQKQGVEQEQTGEVYFNTLLLREADLYPQIGDHLLTQGFRYEVMEVIQKPEDLFQTTNLPLVVTARVRLYRGGEGGVVDGGKR